MTGNNIGTIKRGIVAAIKDLDQSDHIDICTLIKTTMNDTSGVVSETPRGTFINLDAISDPILMQLYNMVNTKMQRIAER